MTPEFRSGALADTVRAVADDLMDLSIHMEDDVTMAMEADAVAEMADRLRKGLEEVGEHP